MKSKILILVCIAILLCTGGVVIYYNTPHKQALRLIDKGYVYLSDNKIDSAIESYKKAIAKDSDNEEAYLGLLDSYKAAGDNESIIQLYQDSKNLNSDLSTKISENASNYFQSSAEQSIASNDIKNASKYADYVLKLDGNDSQIKENISTYYKSNIENAINEGDTKQAIAYIDEAISETGDSSFSDYKDEIPYALMNELKIIPLGEFRSDYAVGFSPPGANLFATMSDVTATKSDLVYSTPELIASSETDKTISRGYRITCSTEVEVKYAHTNWEIQIAVTDPKFIDYYTGMIYGGGHRVPLNEVSQEKYDFLRNGMPYVVDYSETSDQSVTPIEQGDGYVKLLFTINYYYVFNMPKDYDGLLLEYNNNPDTRTDYINEVNGVTDYEGYRAPTNKIIEKSREFSGQQWYYQFDTPDDAKDFIFMRVE